MLVTPYSTEKQEAHHLPRALTTLACTPGLRQNSWGLPQTLLFSLFRRLRRRKREKEEIFEGPAAPTENNIDVVLIIYGVVGASFSMCTGQPVKGLCEFGSQSSSTSGAVSACGTEALLILAGWLASITRMVT